MNELFRKRKSTHKDKTVRLQMLAKQESLLSWSRNQEENAAALRLKGEERKSELQQIVKLQGERERQDLTDQP